jgi:hypothetical protein
VITVERTTPGDAGCLVKLDNDRETEPFLGGRHSTEPSTPPSA